jgi:hypothetical protein
MVKRCNQYPIPFPRLAVCQAMSRADKAERFHRAVNFVLYSITVFTWGAIGGYFVRCWQ